MIEIHPKEIKGAWEQGFVLDVHTVSSTMIGYNEFGHPEFDTQRSQLGELVYRLKYKSDKTVVPAIIETIAAFLKNWGIDVDLVVPMPPSKLQRNLQPVITIASELGKALGIPVDTTSLRKSKSTPQMKDIGDFSARVAALEAAFTAVEDLAGKRILLIDDLFQSGASMNVAARTLKNEGKVKSAYAIALTRTRN